MRSLLVFIKAILAVVTMVLVGCSGSSISRESEEQAVAKLKASGAIVLYGPGPNIHQPISETPEPVGVPDDVVVDVSLLSPNTTSSDLLPLHSLSHLQDLFVTGSAVNDDAVLSILGVVNLQNLVLSNVSISADGLRLLLYHKPLISLTLAGPWVSNEHILVLAAHANVQALGISDSDANDANFSYIGNLNELLALGIARCEGIGYQTLASIGRLPELIELSLGNVEIDADSLEALCELKQLVSLSLSGEFQTTDLSSLTAMTLLEDLRLIGLKADDDAMVALANLPALMKVEIDASAVTDAGMASLAQSTSITNLKLFAPQISLNGLRSLAKIRTLEQVILDETGSLSSEDLEEFRQLRPDCQIRFGIFHPNGFLLR
ncbi:MAG: hypothetical protein AAF664_13575 [Planctomycetota bacterium]